MNLETAKALLETISAPGVVAAAIANPVDRKRLRSLLDAVERQIKRTRQTIDRSRGRYSVAAMKEAGLILELLLKIRDVVRRGFAEAGQQIG